MSDDLIKSELFGHRRGAFTGAIEDRRGHFDAAAGGSLFLDEIGDLPLAVQGMLNTAIEERRITPVGASEDLTVDVRIIAATSRDLNELVDSGRFRHDLLGRLSVLPLHIPPLREHPEDIPDLAAYFIGRLTTEMALPPVTIDAVALERLQRHRWPYNVRELKNAIERALIFHGARGIFGEEAFSFLPGPERGPYPAAAGEIFAYKPQRDALLLAFKRDLFTRAFRAAGGTVERPRPAEINRVAELTGLTAKGVRDVVRELNGSDEEA